MIEDELSKVMDEGRAIIRTEVEGLKQVVREQARAAATAIRREADHVRREIGEYTGNAELDEDQEEPPRTQVAEDPVKAAADRAEAAAAAAQALPIVSPVAEQQTDPDAPAAPPQADLTPLPPGMPAPDWQKQ